MKTRNLIFICLMCLVGGFLVYPIVIRTEPIMDTDTLYVHSVSFDTIAYETLVPVNKYLTVHIRDTVYTTIFEPVLVPADTLEIIKEYLTVKTFKDTLINDDKTFFQLNETLYANRIINRDFIYRNTEQTITNVIPARGLYFNSTLSIAKGFVYPTVGITYLRDKSLYSAGFGYYKNPVFTIGYGFKFR